MPAVYF